MVRCNKFCQCGSRRNATGASQRSVFGSEQPQDVITTCGESLRPSEDKEVSQCRTCARIATVSLWKTAFGGSLPEKPQSGGAQFVEKSMTGGNRTGFWSCKQDKALSRPRSSKRMRYQLKLLANHQEDGDGLSQNIVTNLGKGSRKGLTDGLRNFIKVDSRRALDVGELHRGTGTFKVRKPKVLEG